MPTMIEPGFEKRLQALSPRQALAFMAALGERLMPNYRLYAEIGAPGDAHGVTSILALVWESLGVRDANINFERQAEKLAACEPPEDDDSFGARIARDLTLALSACMDVLSGPAGEAPVDVSRLSIGGIERFIEMSAGEAIQDDTEREALIDTHELMSDERAFQLAVLERVETQTLDREGLRELRALGKNEGFSNLGLTADQTDE
ncbi:YjaG family protein [Kushneria sp. TE3]|uniref:YjaG family protein n=1 Tax=Kushneria sp. TE3 TaxID=3449832 RepID=UPI003F687443